MVHTTVEYIAYAYARLENITNPAPDKIAEFRFNIANCYATLLRRDLTKNGTQNQSLIKFATEVEKVKSNECLGSCKTELRTKNLIPASIKQAGKLAYYQVASIDLQGSLNFSYIQPGEIKYLTEFSKPRYTVINQKIVILNAPNIKYIAITDYFADASKISEICKTDVCSSENETYPIPEDYIPLIFEMLAKLYNTARATNGNPNAQSHLSE